MENRSDHRALPSLKKFINDNKLSLWITGITLLIAYGIKLFIINISHDTEAIMQAEWHLYRSWKMMSRYGLLLVKKLIGTYTFNPYLAMVGTCLMMVFNAILWEYIIYWLSSEKRRARFKYVSWILPTFYYSSMIVAEFTGFLLMSYEINIALALLGISMIFLVKVFRDHQSKLLLLPAIAITAVNFSIYQAFVPFFCGVTAIVMILLYEQQSETECEDHNSKWYFFFLVKMVVVFLVSFIIYEIIGKLVMSYWHLEATEYISDQIAWGTTPFMDCVRMILYHLMDVFLARKIFYSWIYLITFAIVFIYLVVKLTRKETACGWYFIAGCFILAAPFMMTVLLGTAPTARTEILLPFVTGFWLQFLIGKLTEREAALFGRENLTKYVSLICAVVIGIVCLAQAQCVSRLYYTEYAQRQYDSNVALKISERIDALNLGESPEEPVIFVGHLMGSEQNGIYTPDQLELTGLSFFSVSFGTVHGTWVMMHYMQSLGYKLNMESMPNTETVERAEEIAVDMPCWPDEGSVALKDGIIVVNLGNN